MRMLGSSNDMMSESTERRDSRTLRPTMVSGTARSDIGGLLLRKGRGVGWVAGQGEEHVVEGGVVQAEPGARPAIRVELVEQGPQLAGRPVGADGEGQP